MVEDTRKMHVIEQVLKLDDQGVLKELETILRKSKSKKTSAAKERFLRELKASVQEVALARKGKLRLQSAKEFLNVL